MKVKPLPRLRTSASTKRQISQALQGRKRKPEAVTKAVATRKTRPLTEAEVEQRRAAAKAPRKTAAQKLAECRKARDKRQAPAIKRREDQLAADMAAAYRMRSWELLKDLKRSKGFAFRRRVFDPTGRVSNGLSHKSKQVVWAERDSSGQAIAIREKIESHY